MANELKHKSQGTTLTQAEYENIDAHVCDSQATGDLIYASSATQLSRLAIGAADTVLTCDGSTPSWSATPTLNNAIAKGTWTASGTWIIPAVTLGGTITVGANQILGTSVLLRDGGDDRFYLFDDTNTTLKDLYLNNIHANNTMIFPTSADSAAVADQVSIGGYELSAGNRALCIAQESAVQAENDESKFSHKLPVRINEATYYIMLTQS